MPAPIVIPKWAQAVCDLIARWATDPTPLCERIAKGDVQPDANLQYDLGISPTELGGQAENINIHVIDVFSTQAKKDYVSVAELEACKTIGDLMNLIYSRL